MNLVLLQLLFKEAKGCEYSFCYNCCLKKYEAQAGEYIIPDQVTNTLYQILNYFSVCFITLTMIHKP